MLDTDTNAQQLATTNKQQQASKKNKQINQRTKKQNQLVSLNRLHLKRDTIQTNEKKQH